MSLEKTYFIYKYEWDDGKVYIGQTYHGSGRYGRVEAYNKRGLIYRKMKKCPDYDKCILEDNLTEKNVDKFEKYYIWLYNSYYGNNPVFGLNLITGGQGTHGYKHTEESKKKMRENYKYHYNDSGLCYKGSIPPNKGKSQSEWMKPENITKVRKNLIPGSKKGRMCNNKKRCYLKDITNNEVKEFDSIYSAAIYLGYSSDKSMSKLYKNNKLIKNKYFLLFSREENK